MNSQVSRLSALSDPTVTWYGPHSCETCGATIIRAALERGGEKFDPPTDLLDIFRNGSVAHRYDIPYPKVWTPHVCTETSGVITK
jgi:hypothetical protein